MGNEESLPNDENLTATRRLTKPDTIRERTSQSLESGKKMSIGILQKLPLFSQSSDDPDKHGSDDCSVSSTDVMLEDSPVTPPGPDLSQLSDAEREHIAQVIARAKQIERDEDDRLREMENELNYIEEVASSRSSRHSLADSNYCAICSRPLNANDNSNQKPCINCGRRVCVECGAFNSDPGSTFAELLCSICQKKRQIILSSGMWFHGLCHAPFPKALSIQDLLKATKRSKIERTASYSQYEEMLERPRVNGDSDEMQGRHSLPNKKFKEIPFHHSSNPEVRDLYSYQEPFSNEHEAPDNLHNQQINPDYQEVKNRYLQESTFAKSKMRRFLIQQQINDSNGMYKQDFVAPNEQYNTGPYQAPQNYYGFMNKDAENNIYQYNVEENYDFPLVDDVLNSSSSSENDYSNFDRVSYQHTQPNEQNFAYPEYPLVEEVLEENASPENLDEPNEEHYPSGDSTQQLLNYSSSTFKPQAESPASMKEQTFDRFERHNALMGYYDQYDQNFDDFFYSDEEFRGLNNFQFYNNELIRQSIQENNFYNQTLEQSETDSDIAKFAASVANDTAHLTSLTEHYDEEFITNYKYNNIGQTSTKDLKENEQTEIISTLKDSNVERIQEQSSIEQTTPPSEISSKSSLTEDQKPTSKCTHEPGIYCEWCYRESSSFTSRNEESDGSLSSTSNMSKSNSSSSLSSTSNETLNNASKSQLRRCQNYENISVLSESASADTLEDTIAIPDSATEEFPDDQNQQHKYGQMKRTLSLSRQQSLDVEGNYNNSSSSNITDSNENDNSSHAKSTKVPSCIDYKYTNSKTSNETTIQSSQSQSIVDNNNLLSLRNVDSTSYKHTQQQQTSAESLPFSKIHRISDNSNSRNTQKSPQQQQQTISKNEEEKIFFLEKTTEYNCRDVKQQNLQLTKICPYLQIPNDIKNKKSLVNEEIRLVTQIKRQYLNDFVQIQNVELQLNYLREFEKQQMTEIQEKLAEIQNVKSGMTYPRLSSSKNRSNQNMLNYMQQQQHPMESSSAHYYYNNHHPNSTQQRNMFRYHSTIANQQPYYYNNYKYDNNYWKYDQNIDDQRSSYSIHSSPQYLNYGGSYPRDIKYNYPMFMEPMLESTRNFSRSTDHIAMYNYPNIPLDTSHSDQGLFNPGYQHYYYKVPEAHLYNIDMELLQKEQRVIELEREIELRKRQIEETIRYQEELLQLAELNNMNINEYNSNYLPQNTHPVIEYDPPPNEFFYNNRNQQYVDDPNYPFYPYDNIVPNHHHHYPSYYENIFQQTETQDPYFTSGLVPKDESAHSFSRNINTDPINYFDSQQPPPQPSQQQRNESFATYPSDKRTQYDISNDDIFCTPTNKNAQNVTQVSNSRPLSGEYDNIAPPDTDVTDSQRKPEKSAITTKPTRKVSDNEKANRNYKFSTKRLLLMRDSKEKNLRGNGVGMRIIGGQLCSDGHLGAFVEEIFPGSVADRLQDQIKEGDELVEWNGIPLIGKTFEEVRTILNNDSDEIEILVRVGSLQKSGENSKATSENSEQATVKSVTSMYENMAIKDNVGQQSKKATYTEPSNRPPNRRSQSIKRQTAQEYEASTVVTQAPQKSSSPVNKQPVNAPSTKDLDFGSPSTARRESQINSTAKQANKSKEINQTSGEIEKDEKDNSESDKSLGDIQLIMSFDDYDQSLTIHVAKAKKLLPMDLNGLSDPFVKIRLHPDPTEDADFNRQTRYMANTLTPEWQQTVVFMNILKRSLKKRVLEASVWDFDRLKANDFMGQALIPLANKTVLDGKPHWYKLTEMKEVDIPGLRQPAHRNVESKSSNKTKSDSKSSKEIKNSRDESSAIPYNAYPLCTNSIYSSNVTQSIPATVTNQSQLPEIKITQTLEQSPKLSNFHSVQNLQPSISTDQMKSLTRADTCDSKSSNSSSVTTDFLSEEQREIVRKWLGPGQLLMLSYTQRVDKVGNLPDDSLVTADLYLSLRKIAEENTLIVTVTSLRSIKSKNITEVYIKLYLMYSEQQLSRVMKRKTKFINLSESSTFNETFSFTSPLDGMLLQVSLWSCGKGLNVHKMLGEAVIHLDDIEFVQKNSKKDVSGWYKLLKPDM